MAAIMQVRKRNGDTEPVDVNKIVRAVQRWAGDLEDVDPMRVATKTISGLYDGATTAELDRLSIQTAADMIATEPQYSRLAARLLSGYVAKEVRGQGIASFSQSVALGHAELLAGDLTGHQQGQDIQVVITPGAAGFRRETPNETAATPSTTAIAIIVWRRRFCVLNSGRAMSIQLRNGNWGATFFSQLTRGKYE